MTWWARPLLRTAQGATITFGSTIISCGLALQVESSANQLFFYLMPHKYATVDYAYGLTQDQLDSVRYLRYQTAAQEAAEPVTKALPVKDNKVTVREVTTIGFSGETLFSIEQRLSAAVEPRAAALPQLWQQDVIACSMTG